MGIQQFGPTVVESAAESEEEIGFLSALVADQLDETSRLVYADWLEERDDARGPFLREFVLAARDPKAALPAGDGLPLPWLQVTGVQARRVIRARVLGGEFAGELVAHLEARLLRTARPTLYLVVTPADEATLPLGCTKYGGRADLPPLLVWPTSPSEYGQPVTAIFCAQFRLSDLRLTVTGRELPPHGLLSFFCWPEGDAAVLLSPEDGQLQRLDPPPDPNWDDPRRGGAFGRTWYTLPAGTIRLIESLDLRIRYGDWPEAFYDENDGALEDLARALVPIDAYGLEVRQLLGNGLQYNGGDVDDAPGLRRLAEFGNTDPYYWGDSGMPIWYIAEADLRAGRLDRTLIYAG